MPMSSVVMTTDIIVSQFVRYRIDLVGGPVYIEVGMPTPESAAAFAKLVAARDRLTEITRRLNQAHPSESVNADGFRADVRYRDLQAEWDVAFREFEAATIAFTSLVKHMREDLDARQQNSPSGSSS
jgi:hypothetical protein